MSKHLSQEDIDQHLKDIEPFMDEQLRLEKLKLLAKLNDQMTWIGRLAQAILIGLAAIGVVSLGTLSQELGLF